MTRRLFCLAALCLGLLAGCQPMPPSSPAPPKCCPNQKPVMIAFTASWCGPCHRQAPLVDQIEAAGVRVIRIDIDANPTAIRRYSVTAVPTYIYFECQQPLLRTNQANDVLERIRQR